MLSQRSTCWCSNTVQSEPNHVPEGYPNFGLSLKGFTSSLGRDAGRIFNHEPSPLDIFPSTIQSASIEQSLLSPSPCIVGYTKHSLAYWWGFFLTGQETYPKPLTSKRQVLLSKKDHTLAKRNYSISLSSCSWENVRIIYDWYPNSQDLIPTFRKRSENSRP